jgi:hypothetical protein
MDVRSLDGAGSSDKAAAVIDFSAAALQDK